MHTQTPNSELLFFASSGICVSNSAFRCDRAVKMSMHYFSLSGVIGMDSTNSTGTCYAKLVFFHSVRSTGHVLHPSVFEAQNIDTLFFMFGWARCEFHKIRTRIPNSELVFLHPVGSMGKIVHSVATRPRECRCTIFPTHVGPVRVPQIACWYTLRRNCVFASGVFYMSRSALWCIRGTKRRRTIFRAQVGPVQFLIKAHPNTLHRTCAFTSHAICGSHSVFWCVHAGKYRLIIFHA
jgi:hypothetical protein